MVWIFQKKCNEDIPRFSPQTGLQQPILLIYTYSLREKGDPKSSIMSKKKKKNIKKKKKGRKGERNKERKREKKRHVHSCLNNSSWPSTVLLSIVQLYAPAGQMKGLFGENHADILD